MRSICLLEPNHRQQQQDGPWWSFTVAAAPEPRTGDLVTPAPDEQAEAEAGPVDRGPAPVDLRRRESEARRRGSRRDRRPRGPAVLPERGVSWQPTTRGVRAGLLALLLAAALLVPRAAQAQAGVVIEYYHLDALGTVRAVTDAGGNLVRSHDFKPFGEEVRDAQGQVQLGDRKLFTGQERDRETGLDYFAARHYGANVGRFTTIDPLGGHLNDPQSLNGYVYVRNNPLRYTDPTGLDFYLSCGQRSNTCQPVKDGNGALVQGTTGANGAFAPTVVTSASLANPTSGNTAVVNAGGVLITTGAGTSAQKTSQGIFINGTPAASIPGDPKAAGWSSFTFRIDSSNLSRGVLAEGTAVYHGSESNLGALLKRIGAFSYPEEFLGNPFHPGADNFRFSQGAHPDLINYGPSPHFLLTPRVPTLGFHVDSKTGPMHLPCATTGWGCY